MHNFKKNCVNLVWDFFPKVNECDTKYLCKKNIFLNKMKLDYLYMTATKWNIFLGDPIPFFFYMLGKSIGWQI